MIADMSTANEDRRFLAHEMLTGPQLKYDSSKTRLPIDRKKRAELRYLVKQNAKCEHSSIYSQISFICRRLAISHEDNRITRVEAMQLTLKAHEQLSHRNLPRNVVAEELHRQLDKLEETSRSLFGAVMANTNSSVYVREKPQESYGKKDIDQNNEPDKYSERFWADVI